MSYKVKLQNNLDTFLFCFQEIERRRNLLRQRAILRKEEEVCDCIRIHFFHIFPSVLVEHVSIMWKRIQSGSCEMILYH